MNQIHNPTVPFNSPIPGGMHSGKMVKIHGSVPPTAQRFAVNLLCGAMGDIALHISPRFYEKHVIRNSVQNMHWGHEDRHGSMPIHPGQSFDLLILCDPHHFKIAFNGHHFAEFHHRLPYASVTNLAIDGEVLINSIQFEGQGTYGGGHMGLVPPHVPPGVPGVHHSPYVPPSVPGVHPPYAPPAHVPHISQPPHHAGVGVPYPVNHNPMHIAGSPYPHSTPVYPMQPGHLNQPQPGVYPSYYPHSPTSHKKSGLLDKAGAAVAGVLGTSALAGGALGASALGGHKANKLGMLGGGLGAAVAGAALTGHLNPAKAMKKQMKSQRKAQKKALKYGLPIAGAGIGAYALHKGMHKLHHHGHHRSSSSSSSSSSD